jgi:hypothetical protein
MTPTSVSATWTAPSVGTPPLFYLLQYRLTGTEPWQATAETQSTTQTITGLTPATQYDVRVQVRNTAGTNWSPIATFTTLAVAGTVFADNPSPVEWATTAPAGESASGTVLTSTSGSIIDASGATWSLVNGTGLEVRRNGAVPGSGFVNASNLLYWQRTIYAKNANFWFSWNGTDWVASTDPRVAPPNESAEDTALTNNLGTIVDTKGLVYALHAITTGLSVTRNGVEVPNSTNTVLALYHGHVLYRQDNANLWFALRNGVFVSYGSDPRLPIIYLNDGRTLTDTTGTVWGMVDVNGGRATRNGATDVSMDGVKELALVSSKLWRNVPSSGLWWFWDPTSQNWLPNGGTNISPLSVTRNPWDHPGGSGSAWNTPVGDGAIFGADTDADTIDISRGWNGSNYTAGPVGIINPLDNFGMAYYVGKASDPQFTFTSDNNGRSGSNLPDNGQTITATLHVPVGAIGAGTVRRLCRQSHHPLRSRQLPGAAVHVGRRTHSTPRLATGPGAAHRATGRVGRRDERQVRRGR